MNRREIPEGFKLHDVFTQLFTIIINNLLMLEEVLCGINRSEQRQ